MKSLHTIVLVVAVLAFVCGAVPAEAKKRVSVKETPFQWNLPLGIAQSGLKIPAANPMGNAKVELGRLLYFDKRLSADDIVACASCHAP